MRQWGPGSNDTSPADSTPTHASHFIAYACPNRSNLWAILFINNKGTEGYFDRQVLIAEDPRFFEKLEAELIKHHDKACNGHSALGNCKELLGEERAKKPKRS